MGLPQASQGLAKRSVIFVSSVLPKKVRVALFPLRNHVKDNQGDRKRMATVFPGESRLANSVFALLIRA